MSHHWGTQLCDVDQFEGIFAKSTFALVGLDAGTVYCVCFVFVKVRTEISFCAEHKSVLRCC